ncbi:TIGR03621 family F420-dependent LLM class oxidoreductase [Nocardia brasiliensis]|uniref:TIGR03621 family F420-dependent LLM class oxidoreductase n=1 Tax=Nocardia brasiliensis TaxID=37326 RepID=A0A6G9XSW3_NOCBR|nr:TIGR03621 family F420-dependent LLM class oxidoreductase [Nocardia brasiliensis]QIS03987.1 TIGR03621 family F420-dependent LLM class oxidoreductase [Nocardia brasiliensis]
MPTPIKFSMAADVIAVGSLPEFALGCEADGFDTLMVPDHPGACAAPFVALAAAATATETIKLGTNVVNAGMWEPFLLAGEVATLDLLSGGRAVFGIGAGHTPAEWTMQGREQPSAATRVARMIEVGDTTRRLLAGEKVTFTGKHVRLQEALLDRPRPIQEPIPFLVGGNGNRVLRYAAETADIVGFSGLGRTLPDGHNHETRWSRAEIDEQVAKVHRTAAGRTPVLEALVQHVEITDDAEAACARFAADVPTTNVAELLSAPYVLIGTVDELVTELREHQRRWGFDRFVIRSAARSAGAELLRALRTAG